MGLATVAIDQMPEVYRDQLPEGHLILLKAAGCVFDADAFHFVCDGKAIGSFEMIRNGTLESLRAILSGRR